MKDNFSQQATEYAKFRPTYSDEFYSFLLSQIQVKNRAWDCATGNGQIANVLSTSFEDVYANDISSAQIRLAPQKENIHYSEQSAEKTNYPSDFFDLIIVGQAVHWFDFDLFYKEVKRVSKKDATICLIGYGLLHTSTPLNEWIQNFYHHIIGSYWDKERKYIDELYTTLPFPFQEIPTPSFQMEYVWNLQQFIGYLHSWSAVQHFKNQNHFNPIDAEMDSLLSYWGAKDTVAFHFPVLLRLGSINS